MYSHSKFTQEAFTQARNLGQKMWTIQFPSRGGRGSSLTPKSLETDLTNWVCLIYGYMQAQSRDTKFKSAASTACRQPLLEYGHMPETRCLEHLRSGTLRADNVCRLQVQASSSVPDWTPARKITTTFTGPKTGRLKRVEPKRSLFGDCRGVLKRK